MHLSLGSESFVVHVKNKIFRSSVLKEGVMRTFCTSTKNPNHLNISIPKTVLKKSVMVFLIIMNKTEALWHVQSHNAMQKSTDSKHNRIPVLSLRQQTFTEYLPGPHYNQRCWRYKDKAKKDTVLKELNLVSIFIFQNKRTLKYILNIRSIIF